MTSVGNKVLIIDDDEKLRKLLKEYLEGNGFKVLTLAGGSMSRKPSKELPEIVILDIMLPGKDGLEVLKEIRMDDPIP
jgi:DNA-binding response OmpR family regulator